MTAICYSSFNHPPYHLRFVRLRCHGGAFLPPPPLSASSYASLSPFFQSEVAMRNIRRDALKAYEKLEKEKELWEDNVRDLSSDVQEPLKP
ncbi:Ribosome-recycling factor, chloroplastic, partial [Cucurbita argyrosperma subsp. sororia]